MKDIRIIPREQLDRMKRDARPDDPLYPLFEHIAALEVENAELRRDLQDAESWLQEYGMELVDVKAVKS